MKKMKLEDPLDSSMRVLKSATCSTLSGKSILTYHIGCTPDSEIYLRVHENTGAGYFSREWVALTDIQQVLKKSPEGKPVFSYVLHPLFNGKSVNNHAFLLAVLIQEKLLRPLKSNRRLHEILDPGEFTTKVGKLISSKTGGKTGGDNTGKAGGGAGGKTVGEAGGDIDGKTVGKTGGGTEEKSAGITSKKTASKTGGKTAGKQSTIPKRKKE